MKLVLVETYAARGRSWWSERSEREQALIAVLAGLATVALVLLLVVRPLQAARARALADIRTYETLSAGLRAAGPDLGKRAVLGGSLSTIVTGSAATAGLTIQRLEPEGDGTRVIVDNASYDAVMSWLAELDRSGGVRIAELKLERSPTPGMVGVNLLLAQ